MATTYNHAGIPGSVLTSTGLNGTSANYTTGWTQPNHNFISNNGTPLMTIPANSNEVVLEKTATLEVKGTVMINGQDLEERLNTIETVLQIPTRDVTLEAKYPKLGNLYKQYMRELEKYKTWERVKGND
jgi:lipopolysaccharide export system protein LptC